MYLTMNLIITTIITMSVIFGGEAKLDVASVKLSDSEINNGNIKLTIESQEDIYGIQFDIHYNATQLRLTEDAIISNVKGVKIYSRIEEDGVARVLMFGLVGEKLLDVSVGGFINLIDIQFQPEKSFIGTSIVELFNITLAGKAGLEIELNRSSTYAFEVSFITPQITYLAKNHPNPFNPTTTIDYELSAADMVSLIVYDLKGVAVRTLVDGYKQANYHYILWNGLNDNGEAVSSGRYILKMTTSSFSDSITMTLIK